MWSALRAALQKEGKRLALLKAPSKQPKTTTLQVRLEEEVRHKLDRYAEFIGANASYVVSEALKFLFKRDDEFKRWLGEHTNNINQQQIKGDVLTKTA
jgi:predicted transcriptional regulator